MEDDEDVECGCLLDILPRTCDCDTTQKMGHPMVTERDEKRNRQNRKMNGRKTP
jgi:hypothetical protein